jgi:hypothetical protein
MPGHCPAAGGFRLRRVFGSAQVEPVSGRLFLCLACGSQVVICRCCDRGQIYCSGACSQRARRQSQRAAARRYAASLAGRRSHAARMGRYRARQQIVTHHGSPTPPASGVLPPDAMAMSRDDASPAEPLRLSLTHCHWCDRRCLPQLRQGFLRRRDRRRGRVGPARTERNAPW